MNKATQSAQNSKPTKPELRVAKAIFRARSIREGWEGAWTSLGPKERAGFKSEARAAIEVIEKIAMEAMGEV